MFFVGRCFAISKYHCRERINVFRAHAIQAHTFGMDKSIPYNVKSNPHAAGLNFYGKCDIMGQRFKPRRKSYAD